MDTEEVVVTCSNVLLHIWLEGLGTSKKSLYQDSWLPHQDLNLEPSKYKVGVLQCFILIMCLIMASCLSHIS
jgi:hypothetical protein